MSPTPNNKVKFEKSIDYLQDAIQKMYQNEETSNEIKKNMDERIEKIISEVSVDLSQLPEGSHSGTYGIGVGMVKSTYDLFISHSKAWKAATAAAFAAQRRSSSSFRPGTPKSSSSGSKDSSIAAGYYVETSGKPNRGTFHRFDNTPSRPASPRVVGISNNDDSPIRMGRPPARLPPRPTLPKPAEPPPKTLWDVWAEAEAEETKKWGEDLDRLNRLNFDETYYQPHPEPYITNNNHNMAPVYHSPRPRHAYAMPPQKATNTYVYNAANFRTGKTPPDRPRRIQPEYTRY